MKSNLQAISQIAAFSRRCYLGLMLGTGIVSCIGRNLPTGATDSKSDKTAGAWSEVSQGLLVEASTDAQFVIPIYIKVH